MSLHALANNMAARGRGPDSTLVHMSPREVHGLQALAMANGGTLTINPQTGLPEAGFLDSLLPALAGFALNAFLPGVGGAIGGALGLTGPVASTVGTGLLVGGATGLATGSLEKGLMAGLGAYGGAGLGGSLGAAGGVQSGMDAASAARDAGISAAAEASPAATAARLQAGVNTAMSAPTDFLKSNYMNLGLAAAPALSGAFDEQTSSAPKIHPGYIRKYDRDPVTGTLYQVSATPADQYTGGINFGGVPEIEGVPPVKGYAQGGVPKSYLTDDYGRDFGDPNFGQPSERYEGITIQGGNDEYGNLNGSDAARRAMLRQPASLAPPNGDNYGPITTMPVDPNESPVVEETGDEKTINFGGVGQLEPINLSPADLAMSDSQRVQNYLMGKGPNPFTVYHKEQKITPIKKAKKIVEEVKQIEQRTGGGGGYGGDGTAGPSAGGFPAGLAPAANTVAQALGDMGLNALSSAISKAAMSGAMSGSGAAAGSSTGPAVGTSNNSSVGGWGSRDAGGGTANGGYGGPASGATSAGSAPGASASSAAGPASGQGAGGDGGDGSGGGGSRGDGGGGLGAGSGGGRYGAEGGYLTNGQFDQRYADGGLGSLGGYSDGGRLLRGPGDGVSDSIPATIGRNQPARLADGEFVVPARIVSELGNGSTEAGARKLYAMMDRVQKSRSKTTGKNRVAANTRADKYLPA